MSRCLVDLNFVLMPNNSNNLIFSQSLRAFDIQSVETRNQVHFFKLKFIFIFGTGKSFSEALVLASTNLQYDKRLFMEFHEQSVVILWVN